MITGPALDPRTLEVVGVADGEYYRLITSMFLHYGAFHLPLNMWALWVVGGVLEPLLGRLRFLALYLVSGLGGSVAVPHRRAPRWRLFGRPLFGSMNTLTAGASGAVFGLFAAFYVVLRRLRRDTSMITMILVINLIFTFTVPNISVAGHLGGMITGGLIAVGLAYAPRQHRTAVQVAAVSSILVILWRSPPCVPSPSPDPLVTSPAPAPRPAPGLSSPDPGATAAGQVAAARSDSSRAATASRSVPTS